MDQLLFAAIVAVLLSTTSAFNCPNTCVCYQTQNNQQAANCTDLEALHKHLIKQKNPHLDVLTLKDSSITKINGQLDRLADLKILNLSGNNIKSVKRLPKHLIKLDLRKNFLTSIDAFELPRSLEELYLAENHLEVLPISISRLVHLQKLHLANNPLSCSCDTLKVRDWLLKNAVASDKITCSIEYREAVPWTEIKATENCPKSTKRHDLDDFMQGDDPFALEGSGSKSNDLPDDDDDDDVFISVSTEAPKKVETASETKDDEYEASGDGSDFNFEDPIDASDLVISETTLSNADSAETSHVTEKTLMETTTPLDDTEDDGSGSGGGPLILFPDDEDMPFFSSENPITDEPFTSSKSSFGDFSSLFNWFGSSDDDTEDEVPETTTQLQEVLTSEAPVFKDLEPVVEPEIIKEEAPPTQETIFINQPKSSNTTKEEINIGNVQSAKVGDNSTTYACLGVLSFLLLVLILFVIFKKRKTDKRRKRQQKRDAENPGTEMKDINKKLIERNDAKPKTNGNFESVPLVSNGDKKNQSGPRIIPATVHNNGDTRIEPVINKPIIKPQAQSQPHTNGKSLEKLLDHPKTKQITDVPAVHGQPSPVNDRISGMDQDEPTETDQTPIYPNDCKVRIKLKENPDSVPKTPVLVTRTRSNAGDIILTPVNNGVTTLT